MAALRPLQDRRDRNGAENAPPPGKAQAVQPKRAALAAIDQNRPHRKAQPQCAKSVQPPVKQFQAFSVYEEKDKDEGPKREERPERKAFVPNDVLKLPSPQPLQTLQTLQLHSQHSHQKSAKSATPDKKATAKTPREQFFHVALYRDQIYNYMREIEVQKKYRARPDYMNKQGDITHSMRAILVDWLVEVSEEYRLQSETLYLAVSYIDRFLSYMAVCRTKLQLVGTTAMFIASKFEEIYPPELREFVYITDETYTKEQVLRMEHLILKILSFDLSPPTPLAFISLFCISNGLSQRILYMAMYISELSLLEAEPYLQYPASIMGASALAIARHALLCCHCCGKETSAENGASPSSSTLTCVQVAWPRNLTRSSGYELADLENCMRSLAKTHANAASQPHQAIVEKYKLNKYDGVAHIEPKSMYLKMDCVKKLPELSPSEPENEQN